MLAAGLGEAGAGRRVDKADQGRRGKMDARAGTFFIIFPTEANTLTLASQPPGVREDMCLLCKRPGLCGRSRLTRVI